MAYHLTTDSGHSMFEVASALQKCIRRGLEEEAVYWAMELESRYYKYLWRRLEIIAHEDIGPANSQAAVQVYQFRKQYMERREEGHLMTLALVHAVVLLCRSPKSRVTDHLTSIIYLDRDYRLEIPDFAFDKHTSRGKAMGRGIDHFYEEGAKIHPDAGDNDYLDRAWKVDADKKPRAWFVALQEKLRGSKKKMKQESLFD